MTDSFYKKLFESHQDCPKCPSPVVIADFFVDLLQTLFPDFSKKTFSSEKELVLHLEKLRIELDEMLTRNPMHGVVDLENVAENFYRSFLLHIYLAFSNNLS